MTVDYITIRRPDEATMKVMALPYCLVVMIDRGPDHHTETLRFTDHPELRTIYDEGWDIDELAALCTQIEGDYARIPAGGVS